MRHHGLQAEPDVLLGDNDSSPKRLGFMIDDVAAGPSVAEGGERVDVYGYASMAVAAIQVQARQIEALQREIEKLRAELRRRGR